MAGIDSPKSTGEEIGEVTSINRDSIQVSGIKLPGNNDGLTFVNRLGESAGLKVNKAENGKIYPDRMNGIFVGARIYRNWDHSFQMALGKKTSERKIPININLESTVDGFIVGAAFVTTLHEFDGNFEVNPDGATTRVAPTVNSIVMDKVAANDPTKSRENILRQLSKSGDTPFLVRDINTGDNEQYFFTSQQLNELRRGLLEQLAAKMSAKRHIQPAKIDLSVGEMGDGKIETLGKPNNGKPDPSILFPANSFHFENNISNRLAVRFYRRHGLEFPETAVEKRVTTGRLQVMITKHCIQHELGFCKRFGGTFPNEFSLPFSLKDGISVFELEFDCKICMMRVFKE